MKITIEIDECEKDVFVTPYTVYRKLSQEYSGKIGERVGVDLYGLWYYCSESARQLYAQMTGRPANVKSLILTYKDAEAVFEIFKQFADVWARNYLEGKK